MTPSPTPRGPSSAGWYPDPSGRFDERYGIRGTWTRRVRVAGAEAIDPVPPDAGAAVDAADASAHRRDDAPGAAWQPDPTGRFEQRWWNGTSWTRQVRHGAATATDVIGIQRSRVRRRPRQSGEDPGWRPDPDGRGQRYWDGHDWTAKWREGSADPVQVSMRGWWTRRAIAAVVAVVTMVGLVVVVLAALD